MKHIGPKNLVIFDGSNYIKGYRYEIFCASKNNKCTQCTIHCLVNTKEAFELNESRLEDERYSKEVFDALCLRYEYPEGKNRWDAPLFVAQIDKPLALEEISQTLFKTKAPKANKSTQNVIIIIIISFGTLIIFIGIIILI